MSYFTCPDCGKQHFIYGDSNVDKIASQYGIEAVAKMPIDPRLAAACDNGMIELADDLPLKDLADTVIK